MRRICSSDNCSNEMAIADKPDDLLGAWNVRISGKSLQDLKADLHDNLVWHSLHDLRLLACYPAL